MTVPSLVLLAAGFAPGPDRAERDLAAALRQAAALESYDFTVAERPGVGAGDAVECKYRKGQPLSCKADGIAFYRQGDTLVYERGGRWQRTRQGTLSDPLRILGASAKVRRVRLPHEEV